MILKEEYKPKQICLVDTLYALFIYVLINPEKIEQTLFICSEGIPTSIREKLPLHYFLKKPYYNTGVQKRSPKVLWYAARLYVELSAVLRKYKLNGCDVWGQDHIYGAHFFLGKKHPFYVLEDGLASYLEPLKPVVLRKGLLAPIPRFGMSDQVKQLYLTGQREVPAPIAHKTTVFSIRQRWQCCGVEIQAFLRELFGITDDLLMKMRERSIVLLTQNWSEIRMMSEQDKIDNYKNLLSNYDLKQVVIKTHPRERTDYRLCFPEALVVDMPVPVELFVLLGLPTKTVITNNSSGISLFADEVEKISIPITIKT